MQQDSAGVTATSIPVSTTQQVDNGVGTDVGYQPEDFADGDVKSCDVCTFNNPLSATECEICQNKF